MSPSVSLTVSRMLAFAGCVLVCCFCWSSVASGQDRQWFVDPDLVCQQGSALSVKYLEKHSPEFLKRLKSVLPWVVRIEARHTFIPNGYSSNHGSGILLADGRILTARHVLEENVSDDPLELVVTLADGRVFQAELERPGEEDWALLKITDASNHADILDSKIERAEAQVGQPTVLAAYPARQGLDEQGKLRSFNKGDPAQGIAVSQLNPALVVSSVETLQPMSLKPLAGFPPIGGMSGGPIFNLKGEVIGVQVSVSKTQDGNGKVLMYRINAVPANRMSLSDCLGTQ